MTTKLQFLTSLLYFLSLSVVSQAQESVLGTMNPPPSTVMEQTGENTKENNKENKEFEKFEKIEVTGSYIKRVDIEGPAPVKIIDRKMFEVTGSTTIADVLKEDSAFESVSESRGYVRFHGQHGGNVLILLNGLNLPKRDGGFYTSIRSLPSSIIEQVEILKEGVSSLYGSDAMSGVINFITRSNLDGSHVTSMVTLPELGAGTQHQHTLTYGKSSGRGNILGMVQLKKTKAINEYDLGSHNTSAHVVRRQVSHGKLSQNKTQLLLGDLCGENPCEPDNLMFDQVRNAETNISTFLTGEYEFSNHLRLSVLGLYNRKEERVLGNPLKVDWTQESSTDDQSLNPHLISSNESLSRLDDKGFTLSAPMELVYQLGEEIGPQIRDNLEQSYNVQGKLEGDIGPTWTWRMQSGFSMLSSESHMTHGNADQKILRQKFYKGNLVPSLSSGNKFDLSETMVDPTYRVSSQLLTTKLIVTGDIIELAGGPLSVSVGLDNQWGGFKIENDEILTSRNLLTPPSKNFSGFRNIHSAFVEFVAQPISELEIQLASRFDKYSDVGETWNPKLALSYRPNSQLLLRSSVGTAFGVPGMKDFYRGYTQKMDVFVDQVKCDRSGGARESCGKDFYQLNTFVTSHLSPETSLHYNLGTVFQPAKNLTFTVDQWNFLGKDTVSRIYPNKYTDLESRGHSKHLDNLGVSIKRDLVTGELQSITTPDLINMGERVLRGLDLTVDWSYPTFPWARLGFDTSHSYIFDRRTRTFDFENMEDAGDSWKNTTSVYLQGNKHYGRMALRTVSSGLASKEKDAPKLPSTTVLDASYAYTTPWNGKFNLGVKNILDKRPPVDETGRIIAYGHLSRQMTAFSPLGRRYFVSYSHSF